MHAAVAVRRLAKMPGKTTVELVGIEHLSPTAKGFVWRSVDQRPFEYVAGQWFDFEIEAPSGLVRRAYSIASAPDPLRPQQFEIAVTRVTDGAASAALHHLSVGARLVVDGPHGFFTREGARATPALFIATGTGVCPLRAMLQEELRSPDGPRLQLLFGCRTEEDILWRAQFEHWAQTYERFSFDVTLSRPGQHWDGLRGYVQHHLPALVLPESRPHLYICGLTRMVSEVRKIAKESLGYDRRSIHSERYD